MIPRNLITLGILAGGQGRRLGGVDKALIEYRGEPLLQRTLHALGDGFVELLISRPRNQSELQQSGLRCVPDLRTGYAGPLAGIEALLSACNSEWLVTVPVDLGEIPPDIDQIMANAGNARGAVLQDTDGLQPLVALWHVPHCQIAVSAALDNGERAAHRLVLQLGLQIHDISPMRLGNLNTPADFS